MEIEKKRILNEKLYVKLPEEIINKIKEYIKPKELVYTNKTNFKLYHKQVMYKLNINLRSVKTFIKIMLKNDYDILFMDYILKYWKRWINIRRYEIGGVIYGNYLYYIYEYLIRNNSKKCFQILMKLFNKKYIHVNIGRKLTYQTFIDEIYIITNNN